jgi:2,4-dienoyl-CoA reductase-like NADH-dependent reductase (Old Yellow Enzyme family)
MSLTTLFSSKKIGNITIKNRIVRSATFMHIAEKYGDSHMAGHKKLVDTVHDYDGTKIAPQIQHIGRLGVHPKYSTIAPSPVAYKVTGITPRELTTEEVIDYIEKFIKTGIRAYECGYDAVQLHGAHGYFLTNFLSPYTNLRDDEFGGTIEKRTKILRDIFDGIRDEVGKKFPILIKFQSQDFIPNGISEDEGVEIAKLLSDIGFDAIEPSGGGAEAQLSKAGRMTSKVIKKEEDENYFLPVAKRIKPYLEACSLILVGGIRNPTKAEEMLNESTIDFISLCRPLIYEPDLPNRWKSGDLTPPKCISCNSCFVTMEKGPVYCVTKKNLEKKN